MKKVLLNINRKLIVSISCIFALHASNINAQSLEEAVAHALESHPDIRQSFARFKDKEEEVNLASAGYFPTIDVFAGYGYEYTDTPGNRKTYLDINSGKTNLDRGELGLSLRQIIFDGMYTSNEIDRTMFEASAEQWTLISTAEDIALKVSQVYLNYLKTEQLVVLAEKNVASHQAIQAQIKERTDSGFGSIANMSQVTGRLARAQSNLVSARNNHQDGRTQFIRLTNNTPDGLVRPVPDADMLPTNKNTGLVLAISRHPIIKSAQQDINAARAFKKVVKANYYPTLTFELTANADNDIGGESGLNLQGTDVGGHRNDVTAMLRLKYNLYSGGKDVARERGAAYKVSQAKEINYSAHRQVTEGFGLAWSAYKMLGLQKKYIKEHIITSKDTQLAYKEQFNLGQRSLLDLLDTENELFQARQDYLEADFSELSARYRLLNATSQLLDSLRVTRASAWQGEHNYEQGQNNE